MAICVIQAEIAEFHRGRTGRNCPELYGKLGAPLDNVHANYATACGTQNLHRDLAEQPQSDDGNRVTQSGLRSTNPVHGNRAQGCEGSAFEIDTAGRNSCHQHARNTGELSVNSESCAGTGDAIFGREIRDPFSDFDDGPRAAVSKRERLIEPSADNGDSGEKPIATHLVPDIAHKIRTRARFL